MRLQSNWCERSSCSAAAETSAEPDFSISNQRRSFSASGHRTRWDSMPSNRSEKSGEKAGVTEYLPRERSRRRSGSLHLEDRQGRSSGRGGALSVLPHSGRRTTVCWRVGVNTPFGITYGSNITPDPKTGTSAWSLEAFSRSAFSERGSGVVRGFLSKALGVLK
jgi:hypothetical protein